MSLSLPKYSELTEPQRLILNLPIDGNHLITGAPGTGKSVIALYRAYEMAKNGNKVELLMFNKPLMMYMESVVKELGIDARVNTWHSWIARFYLNEFRMQCPKVPGEIYVYDWKRILPVVKGLGKIYGQIIIDEVQDVPLEFIEMLESVSESITCFMDPNQNLEMTKTSVSDIQDILDVRSDYKLMQNFRNTKDVFEFAKVFCPEEKAISYNESWEKPHMIKCSGYGHVLPDQQTSKIAEIINNNPEMKYIGVFTTPKSLNATYNEISSIINNREVFMYKTRSRSYSRLDFNKPGIYVLTHSCMKGLEFDAVIIPRCECINSRGDYLADNNLLYVACTRAKHKLFMLYFEKERSEKYADIFGCIKGHEDMIEWE